MIDVLLIDDEREVLESVSFTLRFAGLSVDVCSNSREALQKLEAVPARIVLLDLMMPFVTGQDLLPRIREAAPDTTVIVMTAVNDVETAVGCMRAGAWDYLLKPVTKDTLLTTVSRALGQIRLQEENRRLTERMLDPRLGHPDAFAPIITRSPAMQALFRYIDAIAPGPTPVLITGETGSGKELFAQAVHVASGRRGACVAVNVAGLDDALFCDTLFGHVRGAFTGAQGERKGLIRSAEDGTLFLDEIGDLSRESQVKLLRLLEDCTYYPVGSDRPVRSNTRIVAATNKTLDQLRTDAGFRTDLYYRLRTHHIAIPPLRERMEDIPLLIAHFVTGAAAAFGKTEPTVPPQMEALMAGYHYPGNVRELKALLYDAVGRHGAGVLSLESLKDEIVPLQPDAPGIEADGFCEALRFGERLPTLKEAEQLLLDEAMRRAQGNQSVAARMLGFSRTALNKRLNKG